MDDTYDTNQTGDEGEAPAQKGPGPMPYEDIEKLLKSNFAQGKELYDRIANERQEDMDYYRGHLPLRPTDLERSDVTSRDTRDTVHQILPSLVRVFMSSDKIVEYIPRSNHPQDIEAARQQTQYFDFLIKTAGGLKLLYPLFFDALARKHGTVVVHVESRESSNIEFYRGLTEFEIESILSSQDESDDETIEIVSKEESEAPAEDQHAPDPMSQGSMGPGPMGPMDPMNPMGDPAAGMPMPPPEKTFDVRIRRSGVRKDIRLQATPPESRWIHPNAKDVETSGFWASVEDTTIGDLLNLGYDEKIVRALKSGEISDDLNDKKERNQDHLNQPEAGVEEDPTLRVVQFGVAFVRFDYERIGKQRLYRICFGGSDMKVLCDPEEISIPYAAEFPVIPEPHTATGRSEVGEMLDIQETKTTLLRGLFDSLGQSIFPQRGFQDGAVKVEDLKNTEPGALIRIKGQPATAVQEYTRTFTGRDIMPVLDYVDSNKEERTGTSKAASGLDADALQSTSVMAANAVITAARAQIELMAMVLAEYGMIPLAKIVVDARIKGLGGEEFSEYIGGEFVNFNPKIWSADVVVRVGTALGRGNQQQRTAALGSVIAEQKEIMKTVGFANPLVSPQKYHNALMDMVELSGLPGGGDRYFDDPSKAPPQQPPAPAPDPNAGLVEAQKIKSASDVQIAREKHQNDIIIAAMKDETERKKLLVDAAVEVMKTQIAAGQQANLAQLDAMVEHRSNMGAIVTELLKLHQGAEDSSADRQMSSQQAQAPVPQPNGGGMPQ